MFFPFFIDVSAKKKKKKKKRKKKNLQYIFMFSITHRIGINFFNCLIFNKILTETNENDVVIKMGP